MKKITLIALLLAAAAQVNAAEEPALQLELTNGKTVTYALSQRPTVTFSGSDMNIATSQASASYARAEVANMKFVKIDLSAVKNVATDQLLRYADGIFEAPGLDITVYSLAGNAVAQGHDSVSLAGIASGVYIVKAGDQSVKIIK